MRESRGITAIVTAYELRDSLFETLEALERCQPRPDEIIVHVDAGRTACRDAIAARFPSVRLLFSEHQLGPGGSRNRLLDAAQNDLVASFDDDSQPVDVDYFARARAVMDAFPSAAILASTIHLRQDPAPPLRPDTNAVSDFVGCGCIYRRAVFCQTTGYVPLPVAYGMEEADLALRLHDAGQWIIQSGLVRVVHDTDDRHHADPLIVAASISNLALLAFLRYPVALWWLGAVQVLHRAWWSLTHGRRAGVLRGLARIPGHLARHALQRRPVSARSIVSYLLLRRNPVPVVPATRNGN